jgi:hypothetical protein
MIKRALRTVQWLLWVLLVAAILYPTTVHGLPPIDCLGGMVWAG